MEAPGGRDPETSLRPASEGQVGIGTLIVFIAMVLVASITAAVFFNVVGSLGEQVQTTGDRASENIRSGLSIVTVSGNVSESGTVDVIYVLVKLRGDSGSIDLSSGTVHYIDDSNDVWLTYGPEANSTHYSVVSRQEGGTDSFPTLEDHLDRYAIKIRTGNVSAAYSSVRGDSGLTSGASAEIGINPSVGSQIVREVYVPQALTAGATVALR